MKEGFYLEAAIARDGEETTGGDEKNRNIYLVPYTYIEMRIYFIPPLLEYRTKNVIVKTSFPLSRSLS